jgi:hypothetical protein
MRGGPRRIGYKCRRWLRLRCDRALAILGSLGLVLIGLAAQVEAQASATPVQSGLLPDFAKLTPARVAYESTTERLTIELPPTNIPAATATMEGMVSTPIYIGVMPVSCTAYSARAVVVDAHGRQLPQTFLHHFDLTDPDHRDLFLPIALHMLAISKETPPLSLPRLLFGLPLARGERLLAWDMLHNSSTTPYPGVRSRLEFGCRLDRGGILSSLFPFFRGFPMTLDVLAAVGRRAYSLKSFDLPPGRTTKRIEGSPAIPGTLVGLGGHLHDYGVSIDFTDVTSGEQLWRAVPTLDSAGHVQDLPVATFYNWHRLGLRITPQHRYRLTVVYDNPTGHVIPAGGMGVIGGLFIPEHPKDWPGVDPTNDAYVQDMLESFGIGAPPDMSGMKMATH